MNNAQFEKLLEGVILVGMGRKHHCDNIACKNDGSADAISDVSAGTDERLASGCES